MLRTKTTTVLIHTLESVFTGTTTRINVYAEEHMKSTREPPSAKKQYYFFINYTLNY